MARRKEESGYALLLVFLMAAVIAISLYSEIPRVAFQSQRHKEQLLMERGLQYMRAIQVFQQTTHQYPRTLDDIETFQMRHFLRHKYIDPMTGKDEWRLIHVQGGVLTDSLVTQNTNTTKQAASTEGNYISAYAGLGETQVGVQVQRPQDRRRPSEGGGAGGPGDLLPMEPDAGANQPGQPPYSPPAAGTTPDNPAYPVAGIVSTPGAPGAQPGIPGMPGGQGQAPSDAGASALAGGVSPNGIGQPAPGGPGAPDLPGQGGNPALGMINRILMGANPQAGQIIQQAQQGTSGSAATGVTTMGAFLAGVASKSELEGIMVYNDQTLYKKWEFVFDPTKVPNIVGSGGVSGSTPVSQMGAQPTSTPGSSLATMFGSQPGQTPGAAPGAPGLGMSGGAMPGAMMPGAALGSGMPGNGANGATPNSPAGMQTAGASGSLPPDFRPGRP